MAEYDKLEVQDPEDEHNYYILHDRMMEALKQQVEETRRLQAEEDRMRKRDNAFLRFVGVVIGTLVGVGILLLALI